MQLDFLKIDRNDVEKFEVKDVSVFKNSRCEYCLKIIYEFKEKNGSEYELELPELPLYFLDLPYIKINPSEPFSAYTVSATTISPPLRCRNECLLYVSDSMKFYMKETDIDSDYFFKTKTLKREMTQKEIEKELGYKVKIITKKKNKKE